MNHEVGSRRDAVFLNEEEKQLPPHSLQHVLPTTPYDYSTTPHCSSHNQNYQNCYPPNTASRLPFHPSLPPFPTALTPTTQSNTTNKSLVPSRSLSSKSTSKNRDYSPAPHTNLSKVCLPLLINPFSTPLIPTGNQCS